MSPLELASNWNLDGPVGTVFLVLVAGAGCVYVAAARYGRRRDRRGRRWPPVRTTCFVAGLAVLVVDLYSGIAAQADLRLEANMVEHMVMWLIVAPLLVASAPVRLALFALPRGGRRQLATVLHTRAVTLITGPVGSVALFSVALMVSHIPVVYGAALRNDYVHEAEHALYLITAVIMWAPLVGADPLRNRPGPRGRSLCMLGCMLPMIAIALWLATAATPVYGDYVATAGRAAVDDQRVAAAIMAIASIPAFAIPALARLQRRPLPKRPRIQRAGVPTPTSP